MMLALGSPLSVNLFKLLFSFKFYIKFLAAGNVEFVTCQTVTGTSISDCS
jgi:hypothetical protein